MTPNSRNGLLYLPSSSGQSGALVSIIQSDMPFESGGLTLCTGGVGQIASRRGGDLPVAPPSPREGEGLLLVIAHTLLLKQ